MLDSTALRLELTLLIDCAQLGGWELGTNVPSTRFVSVERGYWVLVSICSVVSVDLNRGLFWHGCILGTVFCTKMQWRLWLLQLITFSVISSEFWTVVITLTELLSKAKHRLLPCCSEVHRRALKLLRTNRRPSSKRNRCGHWCRLGAGALGCQVRRCRNRNC
jgi:hypothetical protein